MVDGRWTDGGRMVDIWWTGGGHVVDGLRRNGGRTTTEYSVQFHLMRVYIAFARSRCA